MPTEQVTEQENLAKVLQALVDQPEAFAQGVRDNSEELGLSPQKAEEISENITDLIKHPEVAKKHLAVKLKDLGMSSLAEALVQDLEEDHVEVGSKRVLNDILHHPDNPIYHLEPEMIEHIGKMTEADKKLLLQEVQNDLHITTFSGIMHDIVSFAKTTWYKIAPTVDKIFDTLVEIGAGVLNKVIVSKLPPIASDPIVKLVDKGSKLLEDAYTPEGKVAEKVVGVVEKIAKAKLPSIISKPLEEGVDEVMKIAEQVNLDDLMGVLETPEDHASA